MSIDNLSQNEKLHILNKVVMCTLLAYHFYFMSIAHHDKTPEI